MKIALLLVILSMATVGCSIDVENTDLIPNIVSTSNSNNLGVKFSGAGNEVTGSTVDAELSMGLKNREMTGATVDATVSISTNRPSL